MVIEQTLHGYNMGHGLLASSLPNLVPEDQALLFKMSDWTGFHVLNADEEDSYLTAYPPTQQEILCHSENVVCG